MQLEEVTPLILTYNEAPNLDRTLQKLTWAQQYQLGYVPEFNINAIALALDNYLTNPQRGKAMGDRARNFVFETYTWDHIVSQMIDVYTKVLTQNLVPTSNQLG